MREPVTVADQAVLLEPDDVDELVDMLLDAAAVIGHLAGDPGAEAARAEAGGGPQQDCEELAIDLRLAAAGLDETATARRINDHVSKQCGKWADARQKDPRHAGENQHSEPDPL
jgi:hypothetical protein